MESQCDDGGQRAGVLSTSSPSLPPDMQGYTFLRHVRSAASHDTYLARRVASSGEELVVVRVYPLECLQRDEECRRMLERTVLLGRTVRHPHLAESLPPFATPSDLFLIEKFYAGGELFEAVESYTNSVSGAQFHGLPSSTVRRIAQELTDAVRYLHSAHGIAHRNIKLEHVLLDEANHVRLSGLGMAAVLPAAKEEKLMLCCGSKHYAAPEVVMGLPYDGEAVDVWAIGVVVFAALTGVFPFDSTASDAGIFRQIKNAERVLEKHPAFAAVEDPLARDLLRGIFRVSPPERLTLQEVQEHPFLSA